MNNKAIESISPPNHLKTTSKTPQKPLKTPSKIPIGNAKTRQFPTFSAPNVLIIIKNPTHHFFLEICHSSTHHSQHAPHGFARPKFSIFVLGFWGNRPRVYSAFMRRVVITGLGALTPIGNNVATFWQNLVAGRSEERRVGKEC